MSTVIDWSTFTFRASGFGHAMQPAKGKSFLQQFNEATEKLSEVEEKVGSTKNKETKLYSNLLDKQKSLNEKLDKLEPLKDIPHLSEGCKTYLCDIYTRVKYDRTEDIRSKYMEKGLHMEEDAITLYSLVTGLMYRKNTRRENNGWVEGSLDFEDETYVFDTKVNWSIFQFTRTVGKKLNPIYKWQLKIYCWLYGKKVGKLIFCLLNTPEHLIVNEEKKLLYDFIGSQEEYQNACLELRRLHTYDDLTNEERVREYDIEYDPIADVSAIKQRVEECRWYLANVIDKRKTDEDDTEYSD